MNIRSSLLILFLTPFTIFKLTAQCTGSLDVTISGGNCPGSVLPVTFSSFPTSITWTLNGSSTAFYQKAALSKDAAGTWEGTGANRFSSPNRLCVSSDGIIYIADLNNNRIQKIDPTVPGGAITTVAGGNGTGAAANQFNRSTSVWLDKQDNLYVCDQNNGRVQKWAPGATSGVTVAGGNLGYLAYPTDVFVDDLGNIYVSDQNSYCVKKWTPGATSGLTVAGGNGNGLEANQLTSPTGIFVDGDGNIYICDTDNNRVQKWAPGATTGVTVAGGNGFGSGQDQLANPLDVYVDCAGNIYVADYNNNRVQKWYPGATTGITVLGDPDNPLNGPISISVNAISNIYVSDARSNQVKYYSNEISKSYTPLVPGDYTATVTNLCCTATSNTITILPNTTPAISIVADPANICKGVSDMFSATITDGGSAPSFQWTKNGINTGTNEPIYTDIVLAKGDIINCILTSNSNCAIKPETAGNPVTVDKVKSPPIFLGPDILICPGAELVLNASQGYASYTWQGTTANVGYKVSEEGSYYIDATDFCGNNSSDTVKLSFYPETTTFLPADTNLCSYDVLELTPGSSFSSYLWNTGATSPSITITNAGLYWLEATDKNSCITHDSIIVGSKACVPKGFYIPNAFTPDNNGSNDTFRPTIYGRIEKYLFSVFNRYGQKVFSSDQPGKGWDGNTHGISSNSNIFVWICRYQFKGEPSRTGKGTVLLLR